jgi:KDO2-lipid IV(A) lauroyltransferase
MPRYQHTSHLVSASLSHLLPRLPRARHPELVREILFQQGWAGLDERMLFAGEGTAMLDFLLGSTEVEDPEGVLPRAAAGEPLIFCTFHTGSYRLVNVLLGAAGVSFSLVVDRLTREGQGETFLRIYETFRERTGSGIRMDVLDAESSRIGLQAMRRVRAGGSLLFYIDGNTGVGGVHRRDDRMVRVRFLGHTLHARKGIAFLSHATGVPIVPVLCERTGGSSRRITFLSALHPDGEADREAYSTGATQAVYSLLEPLLQRAPGQWEGWLYVHKYLDEKELHDAVEARPARAAETPPDGDPLVLDAERFTLLRLRDTPVLFDRATYQATPLSESLHAAIAGFAPTSGAPAPGSPARASDGLVRRLAERGILVRARSHP